MAGNGCPPRLEEVWGQLPRTSGIAAGGEAIAWIRDLLGRAPTVADLTPATWRRLNAAWRAIGLSRSRVKALQHGLRAVRQACAELGLCRAPRERGRMAVGNGGEGGAKGVGGENPPTYLPTPEEIAASAAAIRAGWSPREEASRRRWSITAPVEVACIAPEEDER